MQKHVKLTCKHLASLVCFQPSSNRLNSASQSLMKGDCPGQETHHVAKLTWKRDSPHNVGDSIRDAKHALCQRDIALNEGRSYLPTRPAQCCKPFGNDDGGKLVERRATCMLKRAIAQWMHDLNLQFLQFAITRLTHALQQVMVQPDETPR